jgi:predicted O-methyltransferase YrrM
MASPSKNPFRFLERWQQSISKRLFWQMHLNDAVQELRSLQTELPTTEMMLSLAYLWRGKGFYESLRLKQNMLELLGLVNALKKLPLKRVCEIGTFRGGTLFVWCRIADPEARIYSIDLPGGEFGGGYNERSLPLFQSFCQTGQQLSCLRGSSHDSKIRDQFASEIGKDKLDFLFIDGDHSYEGVKQDFEFYAPFVAPGGAIGFHDIVHRPHQADIEVHRFWNELKSRHRHEEFVEQTDARRAIGIGLIYPEAL